MREKRTLFCIFVVVFSFLCCSCGKKEEKILIEQPEENVIQEASEEKSLPQDAEQDIRRQESVWVDVCGAVKHPGVYELEAGSRIFEAVEAAGGFAENADTQWLNQAALVSDEEKIRVYTREETEELQKQGISRETENTASGEEKSSQGKVNLNTASLAQLQEIPGIGQVRAQAILDYREEAGSFQSIEEVQEVPGIKGKTFEKIEDYITVK